MNNRYTTLVPGCGGLWDLESPDSTGRMEERNTGSEFWQLALLTLSTCASVLVAPIPMQPNLLISPEIPILLHDIYEYDVIPEVVVTSVEAGAEIYNIITENENSPETKGNQQMQSRSSRRR